MFQSTSATSKGPELESASSASCPLVTSTVAKPNAFKEREMIIRIARESSTTSAFKVPPGTQRGPIDSIAKLRHQLLQRGCHPRELRGRAFGVDGAGRSALGSPRDAADVLRNFTTTAGGIGHVAADLVGRGRLFLDRTRNRI